MTILYRPPFEARSFLLEVTESCSHNKCSFCTMYRDIPFKVCSLDHVEKQLKSAAVYAPYTKRVFLENGDAFVLSANQLLQIADLVHHYLPMTETISMYASINNIRTKTDDELILLQKAGINELNIGVESGLDEALQYMNKGYSAKEAVYELKRLNKAGIDYGANIIFGCAGQSKGKINAKATADLLNETSPYLIFTGTIHADPGCPLYEDMKKGTFIESTFEEYLDEEELLLKSLDLPDCFYFGLHPSNVVQVCGNLGSDKEAMIKEIEKKRQILNTRIHERPIRSGEGAILNC